MAPIIMATLKCLACGHDNKVGDESCTSCSSSLNLKLCSACEAINAHSAERCHSCGAVFAATELAAPPMLDDAVAFVELDPAKSLPARVRLIEATLPGTKRARAIAVWGLPSVIAAAVAAYYLNSQPSAVNAKPGVVATAPAPAASPPGTPGASAAAAPPSAASPARVEPAKPVARVPEANRPAGVTHTRLGAETPSPVVRASALPKTSVAESKTSAAASKPAPEPQTPGALKAAPAATVAPVVAAPAAPAYGRVTHTRAPEPGTMPASAPAVQPTSVAAKEASPACAPAVAALGFCIAK